MRPEDKIIPMPRVKFISNQLRATHRFVMTTNGCFDLLHYGHLKSLETVRTVGNDCLLWVGVNSDQSLAFHKMRKPLIHEYHRAYLLASLECVDYVTIFEEFTPCNFIEAVNPAFHLKGGDYRERSLAELPILKKLGTRLLYAEYELGCSTSSLIQSIKKL